MSEIVQALGPSAASVVMAVYFLRYLAVQRAADRDTEDKQIDALNRLGNVLSQVQNDISYNNRKRDKQAESTRKIIEDNTKALDNNTRVYEKVWEVLDKHEEIVKDIKGS